MLLRWPYARGNYCGRLEPGRKTLPLKTVTTLTPSERTVLIEAVLVVFAVRVALWVLPSATILRWVRADTSRREPHRPAREVEAATIAWAVDAAARRIPRATCLTQAVAGRILLRRYGHAAELRVGVVRDPDGFRAHAWIEQGGRVLIGGAGSRRFVPFPDFSAARKHAATIGAE